MASSTRPVAFSGHSWAAALRASASVGERKTDVGTTALRPGWETGRSSNHSRERPASSLRHGGRNGDIEGNRSWWGDPQSLIGSSLRQRRIFQPGRGREECNISVTRLKLRGQDDGARAVALFGVKSSDRRDLDIKHQR